MTEMHPTGNEDVKEGKFRKRDHWLLPLVCLCTISLCLLGSEGIASCFLVSQGSDTCRVYGSLLGFRYRPNCITRMKLAEGPWVINSYNDCGYRTREFCRTKPKGTTKIALFGSSISEGYMVASDDEFASQTGRELTNFLKHPVEVQNLGREQCFPICAYHQVDEALALRPAMMVLTISDLDIQRLNPSPIPDLNTVAPAKVSLTSEEKLVQMLKESKATLAATYLLSKIDPEFVRLRVQRYVKRGGDSGYLWVPLPSPWEARVEAMDVIIGMIEAKCRKANVPFVLLEVPTFQQDVVLKSRDLAPGVDPYQLSGRLNSIAVKNGVQFVSTLDAFKDGPDPNEVFYVLDDHSNKQGHSIVAKVLVNHLQTELTSEVIPAPKAPTQSTLH